MEKEAKAKKQQGIRRIIRKNETIKVTGKSWSTIRRMEIAGLFPQRVRVGLRGVGHFEDEVLAHNESLERISLSESGV